MSLFEKRYIVEDMNGKKYFITAKRLSEQVVAHNLIVPIVKLVKLCSEPDFPEEYAQKIKIQVLKYATTFENKRAPMDSLNLEDDYAVSICYNSLAETTEETAIIARYKYLFAIINSVTKWHFSPMEFKHYHGRNYRRICEKWKRTKFKRYCTMLEIDFTKLRERLNLSFDKVMRTAEAKGTFRGDDIRYKKSCETVQYTENEFYWDEI